MTESAEARWEQRYTVTFTPPPPSWTSDDPQYRDASLLVVTLPYELITYIARLVAEEVVSSLPADY